MINKANYIKPRTEKLKLFPFFGFAEFFEFFDDPPLYIGSSRDGRKMLEYPKIIL
jgi:hypothetical protein